MLLCLFVGLSMGRDVRKPVFGSSGYASVLVCGAKLMHAYMGRDVRKPVVGGSANIRLIPVCSVS